MKNNLKNNIAVGILIFINFLFGCKYEIRYLFEFPIVSLLILPFTLFIWFKKPNFLQQKKLLNFGFFALIIGLFSLCIFTYLKIPLESLQVDRWSVISAFLDEAFAGNYPYFGKSHQNNFPGPMPFYYVLALPFYALGEYVLLSALGYLILLLLLKLKKSNLMFWFLCFLGTAFFMVWEITARSNIVTYSSLILLAMIPFSKPQRLSSLSFIVLAILMGLLLSTRSVFALVYIVFYLSAFLLKELNFYRLLLFTLISSMAFGMTFLPLIGFFPDEFWQMNPFIIQSEFLIPSYYLPGFLVLALLFAFWVKMDSDKFFYSGLVLFVCIFIYLLHFTFMLGIEQSIWGSAVDISYFLFCVPFLIYYLHLEVSKN